VGYSGITFDSILAKNNATNTSGAAIKAGTETKIPPNEVKRCEQSDRQSTKSPDKNVILATLPASTIPMM